MLKPGGAAKLRKARQVFRAIWAAFLKVAEVFHKAGGLIAMEWPSGCEYWRWPEIQHGVCTLGLRFVHFDGCALGLVAGDGAPIRKPWSIATNSPQILDAFAPFTGPGDHQHTPCQGA